MAFSMFLRNSVPVCRRVLSQQMLQLAVQKPLPLRTVASALPISSRLMECKTTPILNSVRSFRTSPVRLSDDKPHDHAKLWVIEKATAALMVVLIPVGLVLQNKIIDSILAILITAHSFWGLEAIAVDYVRPIIFGPLIPKIAVALVYIISAATLGGLFYLISHDVGLCGAVRELWAVKSEQKA